MTRRGVDYGILILAALVLLLAAIASPARQALAHPGTGRCTVPRRVLVLNTIRRVTEACVVHAPQLNRRAPVGLKGESEVRDEVDPTEATSSASPHFDVLTSARRPTIRQAARPAEVVAARPLRC